MRFHDVAALAQDCCTAFFWGATVPVYCIRAVGAKILDCLPLVAIVINVTLQLALRAGYM